MGKGSKPRPINKKIFDANFDGIFWKHETNKQSTIAKGKSRQIKRFIYK